MTQTAKDSGHGIGAPVLRREDQRFLTGVGRYVDDITLPHQLYAHIVRSPHAHARITNIDTEAARQAPGVVAVFTGADMERDGVGSIPCGWQVNSRDGTPMVEPPHLPLCSEIVRHVGDQVAVIVAESRHQASAAALLLEVDYDELPAAAVLAGAADEGAAQVWPEAPGNLCYDWEIGDQAATEAAFAKAHKVVALDLTQNRMVPNAMEPRAAIGVYEPGTGAYTLYTTSQNPHLIRLLMGAYVLHIPEHKLRVVAPDVGGGFGSKIYHYAEEAIVTWAAGKLGRAVKWTATRSEAFMSDAHGRDHVTHAELAVAEDGTFLGLRVKTLANMGAYLSTFAPSIPTYLYATLLAGCYRTPSIHCSVRAVFTHTVPVDAYRGAGRPEATFLVERLVENAARALDMDRVEIRRKNFLRPEDFPYETPVGLTYDIGNYQALLDMGLERSRWHEFEQRRAEARARGKLRGIGMSTYVEACGLAPSAMAGALGARAGLYESAQVRVHPTGSVTVLTGTHSHGQGHETSFAQIVADKLGVPFEQVEIVHGDSAQMPFGMGTYGSRSMPVGGSAIVKAVDKIVAKGKKIAAHLLEVGADDVELEGGSFRVSGTDRAMTVAEVALAAYVPHNYPHDELEPGLDETAFYDPANFTFPSGCHIVELEIDPDTGVIEVVDVTVADDIGTVINPMIVDGQIHGGLAQGIGQALLEGCVYDGDSGQLITGSYMNYTMPRASDFPMFQVGNHVTECPHNPLGAKGCGEVGAIGVPAAVINAVVDAVAHLGITHIDMPATPEKVWRAIRDA
ncbi:xanthine dehydrogenase family protein molybdopterin-binding subunit [Haliangium ochraceum]|uniref:Aldehyde oxidase and xanthine dehydrogenase molybdopterin binding protein n=1 Tax=Haliangium ochraceum (strain DSM 14365 / JCM 11303 / SMP-2) TaxID=502025 RepID=D0LKQ3_HALO1|nr:xanthine dehydrogenase family protein molybdopterin-binding subunit [Haliangium ochraceum]ACY15101.1 aldehyde oxidase and xanthine dehydrogenase molybdopterin binding protein [Haliangium ochraceum DSM 14365]